MVSAMLSSIGGGHARPRSRLRIANMSQPDYAHQLLKAPTSPVFMKDSSPSPNQLLTPLSQVRVLYGELFVFLRTITTDQLTPGAESSAAGRFAFRANSGKDLRRSGNLGRDLCFDGEKRGSERNLQGSFRTLKSRSRNLGISHRTAGKS
jgi:hypothetical protein